MKDRFKIGELAKLFNISTDTLRHYDRIGLLKPDFDSNNDYRYYSLANFFKLSRLLFFKSLDISLVEIKNYMRNRSAVNLVSLLKRKEEEIEIKINKLQNLKNKIHNKLELMESIKGNLDIVTVKAIHARAGVFLDMADVESDEEIIRAFKENQKYLRTSSWLIDGQIYTSLSKENIDKGIFNKFRYFIEVVASESQPCERMKIIPENNYACIAFLGPYHDMGKHYEILVKWIRDNNYEIIGDSIEKNIIDYGFSDSENEYISEIQIPIKTRREHYGTGK